VEISRELQEARDSEAEAGVLCRQCVQMFRGFSAHVMAAAHRLGIHGMNLPTVPEDDDSTMLFFSQLAEELDGASARVLDLIDAECRELLGLAGTRIFSNLQRLRPELDLEEVLQRREPPAPGTPDRAAQARAEQLGVTLQWLQWLQTREAPPAATPRAPGSPGAKKPRRMTAEHRSPAETHLQAPAKAPVMARATRRPPSKLFPDLLLKKCTSCTLGSHQTLPC
jgi:hypothetical protein